MRKVGTHTIKFIIIFIVMMLSFRVNATHMVGGEMTYTYLGDYRYLVTLKLYRDCRDGTASYPSAVKLRAFYRSGEMAVQLNIPFPGAVELDPFVDTCVIKPGICVESAEFSGIMVLPPVEGGYHILFDTGYRNSTLQNVTNPLSTGSGFYAYIPESILNSPPVVDTLWLENFTLPNGTTVDAGGTGWNITTTGTPDNAAVNGGYFRANNIDGYVDWFSDCIDISAASNNPVLLVDLIESENMESTDSIKVFYSVDGGNWTLFPNNGQWGGDIVDVTAIADGIVGDSVCIRVRMKNTSSNEYHGIDNVRIIDAEAIMDTNSSPYFNNFPPIFICVNEPLVFDHSATDTDGDSLSYELCSPYINWNGNPYDVNSIGAPQFDGNGFPVLDSVPWVTGYHTNAPLGPPGMTIDPITGLLTTTPTQIGQFVVGVCVTEWRGGIEISTVKRDFQFNTLVCPPLAEAGILAQDPCNNGYTVDFDSDITASSYFWDFGNTMSTTDTSYTQSDTYTYPDTGNYEVTLIVNYGTPCADTTTHTVFVSWLLPAFTSAAPQCAGETMSFTNTSTRSNNATETGWNWNFGDGNTSAVENPGHVFSSAGNYTVSLLITLDSVCTDTVTGQVSVLPAPTASAGTNQIVCANSGTVNLIGAVTIAGSGVWSSTGSGSFSDANSLVTTYTLSAADTAAGQVKLILTTTDNGNCDAVSDTMEVTITPSVSVIPASDSWICFGTGSTNLEAEAIGGTPPFTYLWSTGSTSSSVQVNNGGTYTVSVSDASGCPVITDVILVTEYTVPVSANAGLDQNTCFSNPTVSLSGSVQSALGGTWSTAGDGNFSSAPSQLNNSYLPGIQDLTAGSVLLFLTTIESGTCSADTDSVEIFFVVPQTSFSTTIPDCSTPNGTITLTPNSGVPPYTYLWDAAASSQTTATATGLYIGNYSVTISDAIGCTVDTIIPLSNQEPVLAPGVTADLTCFGNSSGIASIVANGGTPGYSYVWSGSAGNQTTATATGLSAGIHTVTVTDALNCKAISSVTLGEPDSLTIVASADQEPLCFGYSTGEATVMAGGGTGNYHFEWSSSPSHTTAQVSGLSSGTYTVTVSDDNGCEESASITITQPQVIKDTVNIISDYHGADISCSGASDGAVSVGVNGGTPAYNYLWSGGLGTTSSLTGLSAGTFTVTITDANGCTSTAHIALNDPPPTAAVIQIDSDFSGYDISCEGSSDGQATVNASGGVAPYTYYWSAYNQTTATATGLSQGNYTVTITDSNGCSATASVGLTDPPSVQITATVTSSYNGSELSCSNSIDGTATSFASGGAGTLYTYLWSTGSTSSALVNAASGTYTVTVTDVNGCTAIAQTILDAPPPITGTVLIESDFNGQDLSCYGAMDGELTVVATGGTGSAYTYLWTSNISTSETATGLSAGTYTVTITDVNGCTGTANTTLNPPATLSGITQVTSDYNGYPVSCYGYHDGSAMVSGFGGTSPYSYHWDANAGNTVGANASGLHADTFQVSISDANNCQTILSVVLNQPDSISVDAAVTSDYNGEAVSCTGASDGSVLAIASGGIAGYSFQWDAGSGSQSTAEATGLTAGLYEFTVTDANGCQSQGNVLVTEPTPVSVSIQITSNYHGNAISCAGESDASILAAGSGGVPGYSYEWSITQSPASPSLSELPAGTYVVTVTDLNGCTAAAQIDILQPDSLLGTPSAITNFQGFEVSCSDVSDGIAIVTPTGGTSPYSYLWDAGAMFQTTATATGLSQGSYSVTITDLNGCTTSSDLTLDAPTLLVANMNSSAVSVSCMGASDGTASVLASGGIAPYTFVWDNGATTSVTTGLSAGFYFVTVTDGNNCDQIAGVTVDEPSPLDAVISDSSMVSCQGADDGTATVAASGSTPPYTFQWSNGSTDPTATGLAPGHFSVTITDANNCPAATGIFITEPDPLSSITAITSSYHGAHISCNDATDGILSAAVSGGTQPFSYLWSLDAFGQTTSSASGLVAGIFFCTITDANLCNIVVTDTIIAPPPVTLSSIINANVNCFGDSTGTATAMASGGTPSYTFSWSTGTPNTSIASNLPAGINSVTATDLNGCTATTTVLITQPNAPITSTTSASWVSCFGGNDGIASVNVSGGTPNAVPPGYTYAWSSFASAQTNSTATGLPTGNYYITITDSLSCSHRDSVLIMQPDAPITVTDSLVSVSCIGGENGSSTIYASGGMPPYQYAWPSPYNTGSGNSATGIFAGTYVVTITDSMNCAKQHPFTIIQPTSPIQSSASISSVTCKNGNNGSIDIVSWGGTSTSGTYTYLWDNQTGGSTSASITGLAAGTYSVTITDDNGCVLDTIHLVTEPVTAMSVTTAVTHVNCFGGNDGTASVTVSGGITPYNYLWSANTGFQDSPTASALASGTYQVTVYDANTCIVAPDAVVNQPADSLSASAVSSPVSCFGYADGVITLSPNGGTAPYYYSIAGNSVPNPAIGLAAGSYAIDIADDNGCISKTDTVHIPTPDSLSAIFFTDNVTCHGGTTGEITVLLTGGTSPYSYQWPSAPGAQNSTTATGLSAGTHPAILMDANSCADTLFIAITQPDSLVIQLYETNPACYQTTTGQITASVLGGSTPYQYAWSGSVVNDSILDSLSAGTYWLTITDAGGCTATDSTELINPPQLITSITPGDTICENDTTTIFAMVSGGTGVLTMLWSNGMIDTSITVSPAITSSYYLGVTDENGCLATSDTTIIAVRSPANEAVTITGDSVICFGEESTLTGSYSGVYGPYTYTWNQNLGNTPGPHTVNPTTSTTYLLVITDQCAQKDTGYFTLTVEPIPNFALPGLIAEGCPPLTVQLLDTFGYPGASLIWSTGTGVTLSGSNATYTYSNSGTYSVTLSLTSAAGCTGSATNQGTVSIHTLPVAKCAVAPAVMDLENPVVSCSSDTATLYDWNFGDGGHAGTKNATHAYTDSGTFQITLVVTNVFGCVDSCTKTVRVNPVFDIDVPNAFTPSAGGPNGGGYDVSAFDNTVFIPFARYVKTFHMQIFNRWGEMVFETNDIRIGWDGYYKGLLCQQDAYAYYIDVTFEDGKNTRIQKTGDVTLIR